MNETKRTFSPNKVCLIIAIIGAMICVVIFVFATIGDTGTAEKTMKGITEYVKTQIIRYDEIVAETATDDLVAVADKTIEIREELVARTGTEAYFREVVEKKRLNGIITWSKEDNGYGGYLPENEGSESWKNEIKIFASAAECAEKVYAERVYAGDYCYDYAIVARTDVKGVILGFTRRDISSVSSSQLSVKNLLDGFEFQKRGKVVVTDGTNVLASNEKEYEGLLAENCPVVQKMRLSDSRGMIEKADDFYGVREKCKGYFIYVFIPEKDVFASRSLLFAYSVLLYVAVIVVMTAVRYRFVRIKKAEREKSEAAYRAQLDKLASEAIRANEAKTDFLRRMSHDVRTPINGIRGMIKIGEYYADDPEKQKECRDKIWKASGYLIELVNDVLDMTKLDSQEVPWKDEVFSIKEIVSDVNSVTSFQASERGVNLFIEEKEVVHDELYGAAVLLKRVCANLIVNAINYNKPNGSVNFTLRETACDGTKAFFEITCADTGIGMSDEFKKRMFEPFEQEVSGTGNRTGGTGLGLAIVKRAVEKMGGTIDAESQKDVGTTFIVKIPFCLATGAPVLSEEEESKEPLVGYNVLVVEDNDLNLEIAEFMLKTAGANVVTAKNGEEGVKYFLSKTPGFFDAVVMDVMMPVKDGLEAAREIRLSGRADAASVPIIAMTANAFYDDEERIKEAGMSGCVTKPLDAKKLVKTIVSFVKNDEGGAW